MKPSYPKTPSEIMLICANLLPLAGALLWGWKVFDILLLYWIENIIVGVMNVFKMITLMVRKKLLIAFPIVLFFISHYGMFTATHGLFVIMLFGLQLQTGKGVEWADFETLMLDVTSDPLFLLAALGLVASHGFSFFANFLRGGEIDRTSLPRQMSAPYGRVIVLHITILLGGSAALVAGEPVWALALLTLLKTAGDLRAHRRSHQKLAKTT